MVEVHITATPQITDILEMEAQVEDQVDIVMVT